eukprot:1415302-Pyramimonas_sp.AAC.1
MDKLDVGVQAANGSALRESDGPPADAIVSLRGHQAWVTHGAMVCTLCGSYRASFQAVKCNLDEDCTGPSQGKSALHRQRDNLRA